VAVRLGFHLSPPTYYTYAERIAFIWDSYTHQQQSYSQQILDAGAGVNHVLRRFYEQLDCVYMGNLLFI
jgi:hypothetical protein